MWEEGGCRGGRREHRKGEMEVRWREIPEPAAAQRDVFTINLKHTLPFQTHSYRDGERAPR